MISIACCSPLPRWEASELVPTGPSECPRCWSRPDSEASRLCSRLPSSERSSTWSHISTRSCLHHKKGSSLPQMLEKFACKARGTGFCCFQFRISNFRKSKNGNEKRRQSIPPLKFRLNCDVDRACRSLFPQQHMPLSCSSSTSLTPNSTLRFAPSNCDRRTEYLSVPMTMP